MEAATNVTELTGSTPPTGETPKFEPLPDATKALEDQYYFTVPRPVMRSNRERLVEAVEEYERTVAFYDHSASLLDESEQFSEESKRAQSASTEAVRLLHQQEAMIANIPATDLFELGLKARVASWTCDDELYGHDSHSVLRNLVDNVLSASGMDRKRRGSAFKDTMPGYTGEELHARRPTPAPAGQNGPRTLMRPASTELERLFSQYGEALHRRTLFEASREPYREETEQDRVDAIETFATMLQAATPVDALFQLILVFSHIDTLTSWALSPDPRSTDDRVLLGRISRECERCLYSMRKVLESAGGLRAADVIGNYTMTEPCNPFSEAVVRDAVSATSTALKPKQEAA